MSIKRKTFGSMLDKLDTLEDIESNLDEEFMAENNIPHKIETWTHRTICDVLSDMRSILKAYGTSVGLSDFKETMGYLIEEVQVLGNRMEAGLSTNKDLIRATERLKKIKKEHNDIVDELHKRKGKK